MLAGLLATEMSAINSNQHVVCVLGMHRSGTSLLARLLNLLGVELGDPNLLTSEPSSFNPKGYWEHQELTLISDAILHRCGGSWDNPPQLQQGWQTNPSLDDLRLKAISVITSQFQHTSLWGWKDPRTCLTLPFWKYLLSGLRYVVSLRHPLSVARSLEYRDNFSAEKSFYLWLTYVSCALKYSEDEDRLIVFYEDLIDDVQRNLMTLAEFIGMPDRGVSPAVVSAAEQFIEPTLQHYRETNDLSNPRSELEAGALALYDCLRNSRSNSHLSRQLSKVDRLMQKPPR